MSVGKDIEDLLAVEDPTQSKRSNGHIYKEYGGFNRFMISHGLRIWNPEDVEEVKAIATEMRRGDEQEASEAKRACTNSSLAKRNGSNSSATQPAASTNLPGAKSTIRKPSSKSSTKPSTTKSSAVRGELVRYDNTVGLPSSVP